MPEENQKPATKSAANPENPKKRTKAARKNRPPQAEIKEPPQCHIHDKVSEEEIDDIYTKVCCVDEPPTEHTDGKYYCLFHLPSKEKAEKFNEKFKQRLENIEAELSRIENLPEVEKKEAFKKVKYDFRYIWFPSEVNFHKYKFSADADFNSAIFSAGAYFSDAIFSADAYFSWTIFSAAAFFNSATFSANTYFNSATFSADAYFRSATFSAAAYFISATFSADADFRSAKFSADADFSSATFSADAYFSSATFSADAFFDSVKFLENANFHKTNFVGDAFFRQSIHQDITTFSDANFKKGLYIRAAIFEESSQIFFQRTKFFEMIELAYVNNRGYISFEGTQDEKLFDQEKVLLDLQNIRLDSSKQISFHTVLLKPNWFVNVDARKFVFTDIKWENVKAENGNKNIWRELESLKERWIEDSGKRLLEVACRQLAVNAEENNRYEDASKFRYMAMETRRLEHIGWRRFFNLHFFYKWSSGYGESWRRAAVVLLILLVGFGLIYNSPYLSSFDWGDHLSNTAFWEGLLHSLKVAALQRPEPKPADVTTGVFIILETIFAPLQAALLALAIRRKFMR